MAEAFQIVVLLKMLHLGELAEHVMNSDVCNMLCDKIQ